MDRLTAMAVFVRVADGGSFAAAAAHFGLSRAMVSKYVQALEERLGARLLHRTTRRLSLTEIGADYLQRCREIVAAAAEAEAAAGALQAEPRGRLRINAPVSFGARHLAPALAAYLARHPAVTAELSLNDRVVDLVEEGYDLAVRIGRLADSSLVARRLAPARMAVAAAPDYLARHGAPARPEDLARHACLTYSYAAAGDEWRFEGPDGPAAVRVAGPFRANNGDAVLAAGLAGLGVLLQPTFIVGEALAAGRLVALLPGWRPAELAIHAVYPSGRHVPPKLRSLVDFLAARFGERPAWDAPPLQIAAGRPT
ncbi:MAG TPA: LysR family transcriptional regulator [Alphaproteobacteria bacterium]|nr:LysR family transcriptional regulator [Alphaproteobacteria bacterium]